MDRICQSANWQPIIWPYVTFPYILRWLAGQSDDWLASWLTGIFDASVITYTQLDTDGNRWLLLKEITAHEKDSTAPSVEELAASKIKITTKGWKFFCLWTDGSPFCVEIRDLKHSNPILLVEYVAERGLLNEPALSWWANRVIKRKASIIQKVKTRYWQCTHKVQCLNKLLKP